MTTQTAQQANDNKKPILVVTHQYPDTDAWACCWLIKEHYSDPDDAIELYFVPAGTGLPKDDEYWTTHEVIHVDTGGGPYDQHGKELKNYSSFKLLAEDLDYQYDPAYLMLEPMVSATDNAEAVDPTSIHYFFTALPFAFRKDQRNANSTDWALVYEHVMFVLDTMAQKWRAEAATAEKFARSETIEELSNGLKFCAVSTNPGLRHQAYKLGSDVVAWIAPAKGGFNAFIQVSNQAEYDLTALVVRIREEEAKIRGVDTTDLDLAQFSEVQGIPGWFLHDSRRLVACGTKTHPLFGDDLTKLKARAFFNIVREVLTT